MYIGADINGPCFARGAWSESRGLGESSSLCLCVSCSLKRRGGNEQMEGVGVGVWYRNGGVLGLCREMMRGVVGRKMIGVLGLCT